MCVCDDFYTVSGIPVILPCLINMFYFVRPSDGAVNRFDNMATEKEKLGGRRWDFWHRCGVK